jgi:hypothetical protein
MTICSILRPLEIFYGNLVYFVVIWYIFPHVGILDQEMSGNPDPTSFTSLGKEAINLGQIFLASTV